MGSDYHLVAEDEHQRNITNDKKPSIEVVAFKSCVPNKQDGNSWQNNKSNQSSTKRETDIQHCTFCDKYGHNRDGCFKRIGYPDWWSGKGKVDKHKPIVACVDTSPIPGLTTDQYEAFLKHFGGPTKLEDEETMPMANMTGRLDDEFD